jgi:hypothetical protein
MSELLNYIGTKAVRATPMTRLAYTQLRGWMLPDDENGADEGFLVEYIDGGQANHPAFEGYVSWSPKEVFERAYRLSETFLDRLKNEHADNEKRLAALRTFLKTEPYIPVSDQERDLLFRQHDAMGAYDAVLRARLAIHGVDV